MWELAKTAQLAWVMELVTGKPMGWKWAGDLLMLMLKGLRRLMMLAIPLVSDSLKGLGWTEMRGLVWVMVKETVLVWMLAEGSRRLILMNSNWQVQGPLWAVGW